jgi:osmotically-inducible protein OsmY
MPGPHDPNEYDRSHPDRESGPDYGAGSGRELTRPEGETERGDRWRGYVVPYRYYGPGYRGVGYYGVWYLGQEAGAQDFDGGGSAGSSAGRAGEGRWDQGGRRVGWDQAGQGSWGEGDRGRQRGGYAGRGPKGYQRSDDRIKEDVSDRLTANDQLDASEIEVTVRQAEVTLTGTVPDRESKRLAEDLTERVTGVRDVMNQLRVEREARNGRHGDGTARQGGTESRRETRTMAGARSGDAPGSTGAPLAEGEASGSNR